MQIFFEYNIHMMFVSLYCALNMQLYIHYNV